MVLDMSKKTYNNKLELCISQKNPFDTRKLYKVYNDGGHFVATAVWQSVSYNYGKNCKMAIFNDYFNSIYFDAYKNGLRSQALFDFLKTQMLSKFPQMQDIDNYVADKIKQKKNNYYNRLKRFRRKANLNYWNYFVTITYDDKKHSAESFRLKLKKCLSNLHTRNGWRYMGVFELSPTGRLHFHAIMYIPNGKMIGKIDKINDYSTAQHKMQTTHLNTFFADKFGRNDFAQITEYEIKHGRALDYLTKYLSKTNERIIYSRAIPTEIYKLIDDKDFATTIFDFVVKYILFDDVLDCKTDIMHFPIKQATIFEYLQT